MTDPTRVTVCAVEDCVKDARSRGWCSTHYERWRTRGTTERAPAPTMEQRFWDKVRKTDTCWLWTGALTEGYGSLGVGRRGSGTIHAHRFAYELLVGPIPRGMDIDHQCRTRACVRPDHLLATTRGLNMQNLSARGKGATGVRGVYFNSRRGRFVVRATVAGRTYWGGQFATLGEAARAAVSLRNRVMTNNVSDLAS